MSPDRRTRINSVSLRSAFGGEPEELHAGVARLSVLFDDLMLELAEAGPREVKDARRGYFIRRSMATLREFGECLIRLDGTKEFVQIRKRFNERERGQWNSAIDWFRSKSQRIQDVRNDLGGHFSHAAALHAVRHLHEAPDKGMFEVELDLRTGAPNIRLHFAGQFALLALGKRRGQLSLGECLVDLFQFALAGYKHAVICVVLVMTHHLAPAFGFPRREG